MLIYLLFKHSQSSEIKTLQITNKSLLIRFSRNECSLSVNSGFVEIIGIHPFPLVWYAVVQTSQPPRLPGTYPEPARI